MDDDDHPGLGPGGAPPGACWFARVRGGTRPRLSAQAAETFGAGRRHRLARALAFPAGVDGADPKCVFAAVSKFPDHSVDRDSRTARGEFSVPHLFGLRAQRAFAGTVLARAIFDPERVFR